MFRGWIWKKLGISEKMVREHEETKGKLVLVDPPFDLVEKTIRVCLEKQREIAQTSKSK